jgi:metal-responsive CopG/Arc/MetJ family transcriptional regulator
MHTMKRTSLFLPEPLLKRLKEFADRHDLHIADIVRRAILRFLDEEESKEKK